MRVGRRRIRAAARRGSMGAMPIPPAPRILRAVGFDDAPFVRRRKARVPVTGVVCAGTRFEGMVWGHLRQDGWDATDAIAGLLVGGKFLPQVHLVLLDGLSFGGFNLVDLPLLAARLGCPCVAVMRRPPFFQTMFCSPWPSFL